MNPAVQGAMNVCNTAGPGFTVFQYSGGDDASADETRNANTIPGGTCEPFDVNGAGVGGRGDWRMLVAVDDAFVQGMGTATSSGQMDVLVTSF